MVEFAIETYKELIDVCLPIVVVFGLGNVLVTMFLKAAFGGKLWVGR